MSEKSANFKNKACFLDRDGVVNVEVDYLHEPEKTVLEAKIIEAVQLAHQNGFLVVVVTNQAGVARGKYPEEDIHKVHEKIQSLLAEHDEKFDKIVLLEKGKVREIGTHEELMKQNGEYSKLFNMQAEYYKGGE